MEKGNILIAGCGYIGKPLGLTLAAQGHSVWGIRRDPAPLPEPIQTISADLGALPPLPVDFDYVFYTAGAKEFTPEAYRRTYVTHLAGLAARLANQHRAPKRLFFTSSTGVYHQQDGAWVDEDSPTWPASFSGQLLLEGEAELVNAPFPTTVVRLGGIYGPERTRLIQELGSGKARLSNKSSYLNLVHRDDCAGVLAHLANLDRPKSLYLATDGNPVARNDLLVWLAEKMGLPAPPTRSGGDNTPQRGGNRKCRNTRLLNTGYAFKYPTYQDGYGELLR